MGLELGLESRVGKQQPLSRGPLRSLDESVAFSRHARSRFGGTDHAHCRDGLSDGPGAVGGAVVHHSDLEGNSLLGGERFQAAADRILLVARRNDDLDDGCCLGGFHPVRFIIRL